MPNEMTLNEYAWKASDFSAYPPDCAIDYCIHGLTSEAGEVAGKWKKVLRDNGGELSEEIREAMLRELGDVLWYVARIAAELGDTLQQVAVMNIDKLADRQARNAIGGSGDNR
jgi:NTP pyrophosphatase (non-canonical NTP hydrolase)